MKTTSSRKTLRTCSALAAAPHDRATLRAWVKSSLDLHLPDHALCPHHVSPLDYLAHVYFEQPGDPIVWACRGGGKTLLGAVATLLDLLFKPGIQIRILGGSLEQSNKMFDYLRHFLLTNFSNMLPHPPTRRRIILRNGSSAEILAQSQRSVRGTHVQKLRCDELELFDPEVWSAAQLVTKSGTPTLRYSRTPIRGSVEVFSTMHQPGGLMQNLLAQAPASRPRFAWCVWDILQKCPASRSCSSCPLLADCQGRAKHATGFLKIRDLIAMHSRVGRAIWNHEMLCHPPRFEDTVFSAFCRDIHVKTCPISPSDTIIGGLDFGFRGAFVCLRIAIRHNDLGQSVAHVFHETVTRQMTLAQSLQAMVGDGWLVAGAVRQVAPHGLPSADDQQLLAASRWPMSILYCDHAGKQINSQTGKSDVRTLEDAGFSVKSRPMPIDAGLDLIRDLLTPAVGEPRLFIDPSCVKLIAALEGYRRARDGRPIKDGTHDHLIDALRYGLVNHLSPRGGVEVRYY